MSYTAVFLVDGSHSMLRSTFGSTGKTRLECAKQSLLSTVSHLRSQNEMVYASVIVLKTQETNHHEYKSLSSSNGSASRIPFPHLTEFPAAGMTRNSDLFTEEIERNIKTDQVRIEESEDLEGGDFAQGIIFAAKLLQRQISKSRPPMTNHKRFIVLWTDAQGYSVDLIPCHLLQAVDDLREMECQLLIMGMDFSIGTREFLFPQEEPTRSTHSKDDSCSDCSSISTLRAVDCGRVASLKSGTEEGEEINSKRFSPAGQVRAGPCDQQAALLKNSTGGESDHVETLNNKQVNPAPLPVCEERYGREAEKKTALRISEACGVAENVAGETEICDGGISSDDESGKEDGDVREYYTTEARQELLVTITRMTGGMILKCSTTDEMNQALQSKLLKQNDIFAMDEDHIEEMMIDGTANDTTTCQEAMGDDEEKDSASVIRTVDTLDHDSGTMPTGRKIKGSGNSAYQSHISTNIAINGSQAEAIQAQQTPSDEVPYGNSIDKIRVSLPDLAPQEQLSGVQIVQRLKERMCDITTKYLPCLDFYVTCRLEIEQAVAFARRNNQSIAPLQVWACYICPLPKGFQWKNQNRMDPESLMSAVEGLEVLRKASENSVDTTVDAVVESFVGGTFEGGSWGLRKWLVDHGNALAVCTEIECIMRACSQLGKHLESTQNLANLLRPMAQQSLSALKDEIPSSYQQAGSIPFFRRMELALSEVAHFEPGSWDGEVVEVDMCSSKELTVVDISRNAASPPPAKRRKTYFPSVSGRITYRGENDDSFEDFLRQVQPSRVSSEECNWIDVVNISAPPPQVELDMEPFLSELKKIEDQISSGKNVPKSMKEVCKQSLINIAKAQVRLT